MWVLVGFQEALAIGVRSSLQSFVILLEHDRIVQSASKKLPRSNDLKRAPRGVWARGGGVPQRNVGNAFVPVRRLKHCPSRGHSGSCDARLEFVRRPGCHDHVEGFRTRLRNQFLTFPCHHLQRSRARKVNPSQIWN